MTRKLFPDPPSIPLRHNNDTIYIKHCVDCGIKCIEWHREWDGYNHPERGHKIFTLEGSSFDYGGIRCPRCAGKLQQHVEDYYIKSS